MIERERERRIVRRAQCLIEYVVRVASQIIAAASIAHYYRHRCSTMFNTVRPSRLHLMFGALSFAISTEVVLSSLDYRCHPYILCGLGYLFPYSLYVPLLETLHRQEVTLVERERE